MNQIFKDAVTALSLANLLFIGSWQVSAYTSVNKYFVKRPQSLIEGISVVLCIILMSALLFGIARLVRYSNGGLLPVSAKCAFLGVLILALNGIRIQFYDLQTKIIEEIGYIPLLTSISFVCLVLLFCFYKFHKHFFHFGQFLVLLLSPLFLVFTAQTMTAFFYYKEGPQLPVPVNQLPEKMPATKIKTRVVWIIFDELDFRIAFENPPQKLRLQEFERFRAASFFSTAATSPARNTKESIPSLITGKQVTSSHNKGARDLTLNFGDGTQSLKWHEAGNIFNRVKMLGGITGLSGWYHPYCRIFENDLDTCQWEGFDMALEAPNESVIQAMCSNMQTLVISLPFGFRLYKKIRDNTHFITTEDVGYEHRHNSLMRQSVDIASSDRIDLAFLHLPFPHSPNQYNPEKNDFSGGSSYFDNLILADRMLGQIRREMEKTGVWDNSAVIISSDHHWRINNYTKALNQEELAATNFTEDTRVPFMVKLPGNTKQMIYDKPFNTVISAQLILAILKGEITSNDYLEDFINKNSK